MPIFPELLPYLREVFEAAEPGERYVITRSRDAAINLRTQLHKIIRRAGLEPWPKLWQNLRATRETELAERWPMHVVCAWIGNSQAVAQKHYLQVTEEHFEQAAMTSATDVAGSPNQAAQNAAQSADVLPRKEPRGVQETAICDGKRGYANPNEMLMGAVGFEPT